MRWLLISAACVVLFGLSGCSESADSEPQAITSEQEDVVTDNVEQPQEAILREIRQQVGLPVAESLEQCRVIGLGEKPCGGPERYLLYSTATTDESTLFALVERYNAHARIANEGMVSDCSIVPEPVVSMQNDVCVALPTVTH